MQKESIPPSLATSAENTLPADEPGRPDHKTARRISSEDIFAGAIEVEIDHNGTLYRLRRTSMGKQILTK